MMRSSMILGLISALLGSFVVAIALFVPAPLGAVEDENTSRRSRRRPLRRYEEGTFDGFTLVAPLTSKNVYLVNMQGESVHTWESDYPANSEYLLASGNLLRGSREPNGDVFEGGGIGGRIQEITWGGEVVWDFQFANEQHWHHHDIQPLPNGNLLLIAWERKTKGEALRAGRDPDGFRESEFWPDFIVEVKPVSPDGGEIVWEWHTWDHLIQDRDPKLENYGKISTHAELVDINGDRDTKPLSDDDRARLEALGYIAPRPPVPNNDGGDRRPRRVGHDWMHTNAIHYHPELDQIVLSVRRFNEIWIIDHSTTTEEAAGHTGGRWGKGGDLLYRWGNPKAYGRGTKEEQTLFGQHDSRWIPAGYPGAGHLLVFNNGNNRPRRPHSAVEEITLPFTAEHGYPQPKDGKPFGPTDVTWRYTAPRKERFFSSFISGAQRLPNGNTLICAGEHGKVFEVTSEGLVVWEWINPFGGDVAEDNNLNPNALFRVTRLSPDHPGLQGKGLGDPGQGNS